MDRRIFGQSEWFEVGTGATLLALAAGFGMAGSGTSASHATAMVLVFAYASIFFSHVVIRTRPLRVALIAFGLAGLLAGAWQAVLMQDIVMCLLLLVWATGLIFADGNVMAALGKKAEGDGQDLPDLPLATAGIALFLIGTVFAGTAVWPLWFHLHIGHLLFGNGLYIVTSLLFVCFGAAIFAGEMHRWPFHLRIATRILALVGLSVLAASYLASGHVIPALPFIGLAAMIAAVRFGRNVVVIPPGFGAATLEQETVYSYEYAGWIAIWTIVMFLTPFSRISYAHSAMYVMLAGVALVSIFSFHRSAIEKYTAKSYLISLIVLVAAFDAYWFVNEGYSGPLTYLTFILVIASAVVVKPSWVLVFVLMLATVPIADVLTGFHEHMHDITGLFTYLVALSITSLYAYLIGKRRVKAMTRLKKAVDSAEAAVMTEKALREKYVTRTASLQTANRELVEMRSALLNVLEDVENSNRQLEIEHHRQDAVFTSVGEGIVAAGIDGKIILANRMASKIMRSSPEEMVGKSIETVLKFHLSERDVLDTSVYEGAWSGKTGALKEGLSLIDAEGGHVPVAGSTSAFLDDKDRIAGIVLAFRDVTAEREVEQQKSSFITVASHQLRTPINAVRWYVDLLLEGDAGKLSKQQKEFLTDISTSVVRMAALIDDLLQVSRAEEGKMIFEFKEVDATDIIQSVLPEVKAASKGKRQTFELDISDGLPRIRTDRKVIGEVLENLLSNAVKYTPDGGKVGIRVSRAKKGVQFEIWDTGYGVPEDDQHRIFEKFYRSKRAVTMETEGTGLGLYIARQIVEATGGSIWFESAEGKGSHFFFTQPAFERPMSS